MLLIKKRLLKNSFVKNFLGFLFLFFLGNQINSADFKIKITAVLNNCFENTMPRELLNIISEYADISDEERVQIIHCLYYWITAELFFARNGGSQRMSNLIAEECRLYSKLSWEAFRKISENSQKIIAELKNKNIKSMKDFCIETYNLIIEPDIKSKNKLSQFIHDLHKNVKT